MLQVKIGIFKIVVEDLSRQRKGFVGHDRHPEAFGKIDIKLRLRKREQPRTGVFHPTEEAAVFRDVRVQIDMAHEFGGAGCFPIFIHNLGAESGDPNQLRRLIFQQDDLLSAGRPLHGLVFARDGIGLGKNFQRVNGHRLSLEC